MRLLITLGLLITLPLLTATSSHKFYVSVTKIEYKETQNSLQIISRLFIDDYEMLLRERYDENIVLDEAVWSEQVDAYSKKYFSEKFKITINSNEEAYTFVGKEFKDDIIYIYLELENISTINAIEITNRLMFELFEEQQNIVRTKIYSKQKSFILTPADDKGVLNFNKTH